MFLQYLVLLALSWSLVLAEDNSTNHIYSPGNDQQSAQGEITWRVGDSYLVNWTTSTLQPYTVSLWQALPGTGSANWIQYVYTTDSRPGNNSITWTCTSGNADLLRSKLFYIELRSTDVSIASHPINITVGPSSSISSFSSTAAATSVITSSTSASATGTSNPTAASNVDSGVTRVALGVGLGIGVPLILLAAIWLGFVIYRQSRQRRTPGQSIDPSLDGSWRGDYQMLQHDQLGMQMEHVYEKHAEQGVSEVSAYREPAELANHPQK